MTKDINLTSQDWIDMIFEGKNKEYGAYQLRRESPKRHLVAFTLIAVVAVLTCTIPNLTRTLGINDSKDKVGVIEMDGSLTLPKPDDVKEPVKPEYVTPPPVELISTIKFNAPIIKPDDQVNPENEIISQDKLNEENIQISIETIKGTNEQTGVDIATIRENSDIAGEKPREVEKDWDFVEQQPLFPGGDGEMFDFLSSNIRYPQIAVDNGIEGKVIMQFVVGRDGSIENVQVMRGVDRSLDNEAIRLIKSMPKWIPGKQGGSAVRVRYTLPVTFRLNR